MSRTLSFFEPIILIGGGPVSPDDVALVQQFARKTIAVDSGADSADAMGLEVFAVLGDMDSASAEVLQKNKGKIRQITEQATTDFEKCIKASDAPLYLSIGFLGGRLDHELAALNVLAKYPDRRIVLIGAQDIVVLCPKEFQIELPFQCRISLFPLEKTNGLHSTGLRWPLDGMEMVASGQIGVSNQVCAEQVKISYRSGALLLILPLENLAALLAGF